MTAGQYGEVDLDLLADFVGGVLAGTSEEAAVARLVAEDPSWARAHAALAPALDAVRIDLADWGRQPEPMPSDVLARLDAALADAGSLAGQPSESSSAASIPADRSPRRLAVVPGKAPGGAATRARRRWPRWAGAVAAAAAVTTFAGFGATQLISGTAHNKSASTTSQEDSDNAAAAPESGQQQPLAQSSTEQVLATGTDYTRATVVDSLAYLGQRAAATTAKGGDVSRYSSVDPKAAPVVRGLERLVDREARAACLDAVATAHGRGPVRVDLVDYASYEGSPALVVSFVDQSDERWAWVVGPDCGQPRSGADTRYSTRVG